MTAISVCWFCSERARFNSSVFSAIFLCASCSANACKASAWFVSSNIPCRFLFSSSSCTMRSCSGRMRAPASLSVIWSNSLVFKSIAACPFDNEYLCFCLAPRPPHSHDSCVGESAAKLRTFSRIPTIIRLLLFVKNARKKRCASS